MAIDSPAAVARFRAFLASNSAAAWWLGATVAVAGGLLVERFVVAPEYVPLLFVGGVGPGTYYLAHHADVLSRESPPWDVASVWPFLLLFLLRGDAGWVAVGVTVVAFAGVGIAVSAMAHLDVRAAQEQEEAETTDDGDPTARARALAARRDPLRRWTTRSRPARHARAAWRWTASVLRSHRPVAAGLGGVASVGGFVAVGELHGVPEFIQFMVLGSLGPFAYYGTHHGRVPVDVPEGRRFLRVLAVVVPTAGVTSEGASLLSVAVTAVAFALLLESVTLAEQSTYLAADDAADGGDGADEARPPPWRRPGWTENR